MKRQQSYAAHMQPMTTSAPRQRPSAKSAKTAAKSCNCDGSAKFDALFTSADLAEYLGVPLRTVQDWRSAGIGPRGVRLGKYVRFRATDVAQWLESRLEAA